MYNSHGYSKNYFPKRDQSSIYSNVDHTKKVSIADSIRVDALFDLKRWVKGATTGIKDYASMRLDYETSKLSMSHHDPILTETSEQRKYLIDMRKGIDWFKLNYEDNPRFLDNFYLSLENRKFRLQLAKKYLLKRIRSYSAINTTSRYQYSLDLTRDMRNKIKYELGAIDIFFSMSRRFVDRS